MAKNKTANQMIMKKLKNLLLLLSTTFVLANCGVPKYANISNIPDLSLRLQVYLHHTFLRTIILSWQCSGNSLWTIRFHCRQKRFSIRFDCRNVYETGICQITGD